MYEEDINRLSGLFSSQEPALPRLSPDEELQELLAWIERTQQQLKSTDDIGSSSAAWELRRFANRVRACRRTAVAARQMQLRFYELLESNLVLRDAQFAAADEWLHQEVEKRIRDLEHTADQRSLSEEELAHLRELRALLRNKPSTPP